MEYEWPELETADDVMHIFTGMIYRLKSIAQNEFLNQGSRRKQVGSTGSHLLAPDSAAVTPAACCSLSPEVMERISSPCLTLINMSALTSCCWINPVCIGSLVAEGGGQYTISDDGSVDLSMAFGD